MVEVEPVLTVQNEVGECPIWHPDENALYWVDNESTCFFRFDPKTGAHEKIDIGIGIGVIALRQMGGLLIATHRGLETWDFNTRSLTLIANAEADKPMRRFNDGAVDRVGRFWVGTMGDANNNGLYCLEDDHTVHQVDAGFDISNGIGWSPDGRTMYFTDSTPAIIYAYDFDLLRGTIANRRIFVDSSDRRGVPDGLTVDLDGFVWSARWDGACIDRYDPDGRLERTIPLPVRCPTSAAFGGDELRDLYITSARYELTPEQRKKPSADGDLFRLRFDEDIRGIPAASFAG
ncbi:MAG: SMP-30/gluconolactonase/LRE family protein [Anaerolineae bacterium]